MEDKLTVAAVPVPERLTVWGLPLALSATLSVAAKAPRAEGVKVTPMVQLPPAATELPQVLVWAKLLALVPESAMLVMLKAALPELVSVIACAALLVVPTDWFPKDRVPGERLTVDEVPVPERLTVWGLPMASSATLRVAARAPLAEGVKVTLMVQFAPAATELPQVLVWAKLLTLVPVTVTLVRCVVALPRLDSVTD